ncbi:hypothetical protein GALMADRAFT_245553 [Galerina marginata CBS 339.88]|uniref:F-box domain-containing protein n=1 Tax=Galerina marginata (strain CBS 339.88) TaxID=685588 RepID=A0A067T5D6_GALM3|nr:hypothetical protein GALMADRAFT_245553 [Galerina marginata CBS 339.88]
MEGHLTALLRSNDAPSEATVISIKGLLLEPSTELLATDSEIQRFSAILNELQHKRETIQRTINGYNTILAPIRRLPADVLHDIFYHCLPTHRNSVMDASEAPVLLTRICSSWRSLAFSSPRIWSKLHIPFPKNARNGAASTWYYSPEATAVREQELASTMQLRSQVVETWLERSGDYPLSLSVYHPSSYREEAENLEIWLSSGIFKVIVRFASRWRSLDLNMPLSMYKYLQVSVSELGYDTLPMLQDLRVSIHGQPQGNYWAQSPLALLPSPQLRTLSLNTAKATWNFRSIPLVWSRLTSLSLYSMFPDTEVLELFAKCHNLVDCKLRVQPCDSPPPYELAQSGVVMPFLQELSINDGGSKIVMAKAFKLVSFPALAHVEYQRTPYFAPNTEEPDHAPLSLLTLLENKSGNAIDKLSLQSDGLLPEGILGCLRRAYDAKHLSLSNPMDGRMNTAYNTGTSDSDYFDLGHLTILPDISTAAAGGDCVLLPNLERLEAYRIFSFTDQNLLNLIGSRLDAWKRGLIQAPLKSVRIEFCRPRELPDIEDAVLRIADAVGLKVELDLVYAKKQPKNGGFFSPSFGLRDSGDYSPDTVDSVFY